MNNISLNKGVFTPLLLLFFIGCDNSKNVHSVFSLKNQIIDCNLKPSYDVISKPKTSFYKGNVYFSNFTLLNDSGLSIGVYNIEENINKYIHLPIIKENVNFLKENVNLYGTFELAISSRFIIIVIDDYFSIFELINGSYNLYLQNKIKSITSIGFINDSTFIASRLYNIGENFIFSGTITKKSVITSESINYAFDYKDAIKVDYFCNYIDYNNDLFVTTNCYKYKIYIYNKKLKIIDSIYQKDFNVDNENWLLKPTNNVKDITSWILNLDSKLGRIISIKIANPKKLYVIYLKNKSKFMDIWEKTENSWIKTSKSIKLNFYETINHNEKYLNQNNFIHSLNYAYSFYVKNNILTTFSSGASYNRLKIKKEQLNNYYKEQIKNPCLNIDNYEIKED